MEGKPGKRVHHFDFPGSTGHLSIGIENGSFPDIDDDELYRIGELLTDFIYGLALENGSVRESSLNIFTSIMKDTSLFLDDKNLKSLLRFANRMFRLGDYGNSLFLSQLGLARINEIIDEKIEKNDRMVDKEIIQLQISTLNFIGYLFARMNRNIEYGIRLATIAGRLLDGFDRKDMDTMALRAALNDTLGLLYIQKEEWDNAIDRLRDAHKIDQALLSQGKVDEIGFRLTCSNLGHALVHSAHHLLMENNGTDLHEIEKKVEKARHYFSMVHVEKPPPVPEKKLTDLELLFAVKRMKEGWELCDTVSRELKKRLI